MRVAISGQKGLIGQALANSLGRQKNEVLCLTRNPASANEVCWEPNRGILQLEQIEQCAAVVHLAGENIADGRWTEAKKQRIRDSRVAGTKNLCLSLAQLKQPPQVLVSASAVGYYGNRGEEVLTEESEPGTGFFPEVCQAWESATQPAVECGIRVVQLRIGVVLSANGGALGKMLLPFRLGLGGRLGSGEQYMSWIALDDLISAIEFVLAESAIVGPVNATSPNPVKNMEFTNKLGSVLHRPTILPIPAFAMRLALGEMADEALLSGARVMPSRLLANGFRFSYPEIEPALNHYIGD